MKTIKLTILVKFITYSIWDIQKSVNTLKYFIFLEFIIASMNREKLLSSNKIYQAFRIFDQVDKYHN